MERAEWEEWRALKSPFELSNGSFNIEALFDQKSMYFRLVVKFQINFNSRKINML